MFWSNGATRQSYIGTVWDGAGKAAVGIDHDSKTIYETRVLHEHMEFRNFLEAGIRVGHDQKRASAEMLFSDLKFVHNKNGALFQAWNDYNNVFDGCHFIDNEYGVRAEKGNVVIRNSRFERSRQADIFLSTHSHSVRRVVSTGSRSFIHTIRGPISNGLIRVEDCFVDDWLNPAGAIITGLRGPVIIFDTVFINPPGNYPPIKLNNPRYMNQIAILSNVTSKNTDSIIDKGSSGIVHMLKSQLSRPPLVSTANLFLTGTVSTPDRILDIKEDCNARGDGKTDDTRAIQGCFNKALSQTDPTVVYFPSGTYKISKTLKTNPGAGYFIEGTGWHSRIIWAGLNGGTALRIDDPDGLRVSNLAIGGPEGTTTILQTGNTAGSARYDNVSGFHNGETKNVHIVFDNLPRGTKVVTGLLDGRVTIRNSSEATLLFGFLVSVQLTIEGDSPQSGFLGILSRVSALEKFPLVVRDSQSVAMTDWYNEQTTHLVYLEGSPKDNLGLVALDHTQAATTGKVITEIQSFNGTLAQFGGMFGQATNESRRRISNKIGSNTDILLVGNTYWYTAPIDIESGSHIKSLGNSVHKKALGPFSVIRNTPIAQSEHEITRVLDVFRTLGKYDLELNYCRVTSE